MNTSEKLKRVAEFHGHLGPYLIIGLKMGEISNEILGKEGGAGTGHPQKRVIVKTGLKPPISCIIDGIQFSSGCTLGKGNIEVVDEQIPEATFILERKSLTIKLKKPPAIGNRNLEEIAKEIYHKPNEDLFNIIKIF